MRRTLEPILNLLDEGLRLYRRSFAPLLMLAGVAALPLGLTLVALVLASDWLASGFGSALLLLITVGGLPLSLYVMCALSRAALMAADGEAVRVRAALAMGPLRVVGMGCYGTLFSLAASIAVSTISTICFCAAYIVIIAVAGTAFAIGFAGGALGSSAAGFLIALGVIGFLLIYAVSLVLNGAIFGSVVFALQPFAHERARLVANVGRSLDLMGFRFGQNLLIFLCASLVFSAAVLAATLAIGVLVPLPVFFLLGTESTVAQAITAAAWVTGLSAALPLLPIWMALLYRRRRADRDGADLAAQLAALSPPAAEL